MDYLTLNQIDFKWVEETDEPKLLKKALKMLKDDGGFFTDLEKEIENKLLNVDKKFKTLKEAQTVKISSEEIKKQTNDILNWEKDIKKSDKILSGGVSEKEIFDDSKSQNREKEISEIHRKKQAENEKIKGNELMKTKEYDEAIRYYNNSLNFDPNEPTTFCNRALAFIKQKNFEKGLNDCNKAIEIKKDYTKAYYRRAVCLLGMNRFRDSFEDMLNILSDSPNSEEILEELKNLKEKWSTTLGKDEWKKIEKDFEIEIAAAKRGEKKKVVAKTETQPAVTIPTTTSTTTSTTTTSSSTSGGFKKMKIVEESIEELKKEEEFKISPHLQKVFDKFIKSGEDLKLELARLMTNQEFKKASELTRGSLKDCQNFIKDFKIGSKYHLQLEKAISDLNSLLSTITIKINSEAEKEATKTSEVTSEADNKKYYKTKILSDEVRDTATKLAEAEMNFNDFPKTSYGFEKAYNSMKKRPDVFFNYLRFLTAKNLANFYKTSELSYQTLIGILQTLRQNGLSPKENANVCVEYLVSIPKTKNFALIKKFLKKSDKEDLKDLVNKLKESYNDLVEATGVDFDKIYF